MKPLLFSLAFLFTALTAQSQTPYYYYHKNVDDSVAVYMMGDFAKYDTTHKATFTEIDSIAFKNYKKAFKPQVDTTRKNITWLDTTMVIKTAKGNFTFQHRQKSERYDIVLYYYMGYIKPLNMYVVTGVDSPNEVSWMHGIEKSTGKWYMIPSSDGGNNIPLLSPDGNYLLTWDSDVYENDGASIDIYKVTKGKKGFNYNLYWETRSTGYYDEADAVYSERANALWNFAQPEVPDSIRFADDYVAPAQYAYGSWLMNDLVWIDNTSFAFKIYRLYFNEESRTQYRQQKYVVGSFVK